VDWDRRNPRMREKKVEKKYAVRRKRRTRRVLDA